MFSKDSTKIMGIINTTPDSFSADGTKSDISNSLKQAEEFIKYGADILDIGGESTRPGADFVDATEEINRTAPIIKAIRTEFPNIDISIDTYKAPVAESAIENGANIINDVWGGTMDEFILKVAKDNDTPICLMHNKSKPKDIEIDAKLGGSYNAPVYNDFIPDLLNELNELANNAINAGVKKEKIILDPGVGFGKTTEQNMQIINNLDKIKSLGYPVLLGASRKSFIGQALDLDVGERLEGTMATSVIGAMYGVDIVRVHDVKENSRIVKMTTEILKTDR
ncbi:MAG: dihydropteroate synthase [Alphaproteobacteria bacterium]